MKYLVVFAGLPGSGKSTICAKPEYAGYTRVSQDQWNMRPVGHERLLEIIEGGRRD